MLLLTVGGVSRSHLRLLARRAVGDLPDTRILLCDWGDGVLDDPAMQKTIPPSVLRCSTLARANTLLRYAAPEPAQFAEATPLLASA